jgi:hypothetical protein
MSLQPVASQGSALIEKATKLGVPMDDLLTAERHQIKELRNGRCPVASLEATLWRRVKMLPQATDTPPEMVTLKPTLWGVGIDPQGANTACPGKLPMVVGQAVVNPPR